jgi:hypothetical protein
MKILPFDPRVDADASEFESHESKPKTLEDYERCFSRLSAGAKEAIERSVNASGVSISIDHDPDDLSYMPDLVALADCSTRVINFQMVDLFLGCDNDSNPWAVVVCRE